MSTSRDLQHKLFDKVNPLVKFSVSRYVLAIGFFLAVLVFGIISSANLGVEQFPSINIPVVVVNTTWPGATPSVVDEQLTQLVENSVSGIEGITDLSSTSSSGSSRVRIGFDQSVDKNVAANKVAAIVSSLTRRLPTGVNAPSVGTFDPNGAPIIQFGISSTGASLDEVGQYVSDGLEPLLERVNGVANVQIDGAPSRQFQVLLNPNKLQYFNLNPQQVSAAITSSAVNQPIGTIISNRSALSFATLNQPISVADIANIGVDTTRGISVGAVGVVQDIPVVSNIARVNGTPVVLVSIQQTSNSNAVAVAQGVKNLLNTAQLPKGYQVTFSNDTTGPIKASIESTYHELFITALVVAIICLLFLGKLNTALSVILAIPIALSAAPVLYNLAGFSFNLVSLLALIVAIGVVVDDSIVVSENVERYRAMGYAHKEAVLKGASEIFSAILAATLSLLAVLLPVSFMGGIIGSYIMQFTLGLSAAVFFSLIEAILFLTVRLAYTPDTKEFNWRDFGESFGMVGHAFRFGFTQWKSGFGILIALAILAVLAFTHQFIFMLAILLYPVALALIYYVGRIAITFLQAITTNLHNATEFGLEWVRDRYANSLGGILKYSILILIGVLIFFIGTIAFIAPRIPFSFIPQTDGGSLQVTVRMPSGTTAEVTNKIADGAEKFLAKQKEVMTIQTVIGGGSGPGVATNATLTAQLVPVEERSSVFEMIPRYRQALNALIKDMPSARLSVSGGGGFQGQGTGLNFIVTSPDFDLLTQRNSALIAAIQANKWVVDVNSSLSDTSLQNNFVPDESKLKGTGINANTLATALQTYVSGTQAATVQIGGLSFPLQVSVDPSWLRSSSALLNLPVYSSTLQTTMQAGQLGDFQLSEAPLNLTRYNRVYTAQFNVNLKPGAPPLLETQTQIRDDLYQNGLLDGGLAVESSSRVGPAALASQLAGLGPIAFGLAIFLVYLVMGAQFNSWRYPLYLLLPVPLALVGALWLIFAQGSGLDIFGLLGMLMLIGLSAKNAILYLDFVVERIGIMPLREALIESARLRFRPIVMTTMTVLVISFPLILSKGQGSEFGRVLGIVMLGGILSSALLTFFVVPAAFWLFERKRTKSPVPALAVGFEEPPQEAIEK